jgi:hypothetical protein
MVRNIDDVKAELRKLASSKPVHAAAGAGVLASQTLRELPWRLVQWTKDNPPESLRGRANGYVQTAQSRANGYVQTARTKANGGYDKLAEHGKKALTGPSESTQGQRATQSPITTAQSSRELNGKPKGKAPSSRTGTGS